MRVLFTALLILIAAEAHAQVYKCVKAGKTQYQDSPCDPSSTVAKVVASAGSSQMIWTGLKQGMTVDEVRQNVRNAKAGAEDRLFNGARELLRVEGVNVAGIAFNAGFFFQAGRFAQVNLSGPAMVGNKENLGNFDRVVADFRAKYGQESRNKVSNERFGLSADAEWLKEGGRVWVSVIPVTADTSMLNRGYVPAR